MRIVKAAELIRYISNLMGMCRNIGHDDKPGPIIVPEQNYTTLISQSTLVLEQISELGFAASKAAASEIAKIVNEEFKIVKYDENKHRGFEEFFDNDNLAPIISWISQKRLISYVDKLYGVFFDELSETLLISLDSVSKSLFINENNKYFDQIVFEKFPTAVYDMDECLKSLALERSTASVFHSMRVMEAGLVALRRHLGIAEPTKLGDRSWGPILQGVREEIDNRYPRSRRLGNTKGADLEDLYTRLDTVRNSIRNNTMHLERTYSFEEAISIQNNAALFMTKLAALCDENGDPKD